MIRTILSIILPFLTPFVAYAVWIWFANRKREMQEHGEKLESWQTWPWTRLIIAGCFLVILSLTYLFFAREPLTDARWVAPTVVDGVVVPGHFEPAAPNQD